MVKVSIDYQSELDEVSLFRRREDGEEEVKGGDGSVGRGS